MIKKSILIYSITAVVFLFVLFLFVPVKTQKNVCMGDTRFYGKGEESYSIIKGELGKYEEVVRAWTPTPAPTIDQGVCPYMVDLKLYIF